MTLKGKKIFFALLVLGTGMLLGGCGETNNSSVEDSSNQPSVQDSSSIESSEIESSDQITSEEISSESSSLEEKQEITGISLSNKTFTYDEREHSLKIEGILPKGVVVSYINNNKTNAGTYEVTAHFEDTTNKYIVPEDLTATLTINKANYDMSRIKFESKEFTYDGKEHRLEIEGDLPKGVSVSYENNSIIDVGVKKVIAKFGHDNPNYNDIEPLEATLKVVQGKYDLSNIIFESKRFTYDGEEHGLEIQGLLPVGLSVTYINNNKIDAGTYEVIAKIVDVTGNYKDLPELKASLIIDKGIFNMSNVTFFPGEYDYDGTEHKVEIQGTLPEGVSVSYENNTLTNAGTITAIAKFTHNNPNYEPIYEWRTTLTIKKIDLDLTNVRFDSKAFVYDGKEHGLELVGDVLEGFEIIYINNNKTEAGSYEVIAKIIDQSGNYNKIPELSAYLNIDKALLDVSSIRFEDKTFVYDGNLHSLEIEGTLPEGVRVWYRYNGLVDAGKTTVIADFYVNNSNYEDIPSMEAVLTIEKADYDLSNIKFNDATYTYDGTVHNLYIDGYLPKEVMVSYENNTLTNVGTVYVIANFTHDNPNYNPIPSLEATLTITKADFYMYNIGFDSKTFVYDGKEHRLEISGNLPQGVSVDYLYNGLTNVGSNTVIAYFVHDNPNYNEIPAKKATLTITKATYDMSNITFANKTVSYDGKEHVLEIDGPLPKGVTVRYENNTLTNAGRVKATVHFIHNNSNYYPIDSLEATLTISKTNFDASKISFNSKEFDYDGFEHLIKIEGTLPEGIEVKYNNNQKTDAGVYEVIATLIDVYGNYNNLPELKAKLTINKAVFDMSNITFTSKEYVYDGLEHSLKIEGELPEGVNATYQTNYLTNVGTVNASVFFSHNNPNYELIDGLKATLTITKADFDISNITFKNKEVVYDGSEHSLEVGGILPTGVRVTYENNLLKNVGETLVTANFVHNNPNYNEIPSLYATLTITKGTFDASLLQFNSNEFTYDGIGHHLEVEGTLPEGIEVKYINNDKIGAGTYEVIAKLVDKLGNYKSLPEYKATLIINKADFDISNITFESETFTYDKKVHNLKVIGELPEGVIITYENNGLVDAGTYDVLAIFTHDNPNYNPIPSLEATLIIKKANFDMSHIRFYAAEFTYDGTEHKVEIAGVLPEGVSVSYENNTRKNAGKENAVAKFTHNNPNYNAIPSKETTLTINRAEFDDSGISFNYTEVVYDGKEHVMEIQGTLPEGITVAYNNNRHTDAGNYATTAILIDRYGNYLGLPEYHSRLVIYKAEFDLSNVTFENKTVVYDGTEHTILISGNLPEGVTVSYENNKLTNAGKVTAVATFTPSNPNYSERSLTAELVVSKKPIEGLELLDQTFTWDGASHSIFIPITLPEGVSVTYENNDKIDEGTYIVKAIITDSTGNYDVPEFLTATMTIKK